MLTKYDLEPRLVFFNDNWSDGVVEGVEEPR